MFLAFKKPLPGKPAQLEMVPADRKQAMSRAEGPAGAGEAAVLALLTPMNEGGSRRELLEWEVLLIRRNIYPGAHSGQISFPGGKREKDDQSFVQTACRETFEEVGAEPDKFELVGPLTNAYVAASNFIIHPFVAVNSCVQAFRPDPREVAGIRNIPMKVFNPAASSMQEVEEFGKSRLVPAWRYEDYVVWGATAMILAELYRAIDNEALARVSAVSS